VDSSAFVLGVLLTVIPFYIGLLTFGVPLFRKHPQATLALGLGMSLYFLFDGFGDSADLGATQGFLGGVEPLLLVAAFALTFMILTFAKRGAAEAWPLWIVAVGISIHSFSEGYDISTSAPLYLGNLGVVLPNVSAFVLHKLLEGFVLVAAATSFGVARIRQVFIAGIPMVILAIAGSFLGDIPSLNLLYFAASGVGGWMFVTVGLASFLEKRNKPSLLVLVIVGFIIVYSGTLLHYTVIVPG
jgi:hypothetical protein